MHFFRPSSVSKALLLLPACFTIILGAPIAESVERRDFSDDLRQFSRIIQLMWNLRSRIGVPFSAMTNVGFDFAKTLEISPLDLVLLPSGYCFSCDTITHPEPGESKSPKPFKNHMVELNEEVLVVICAETDSQHGYDWPLMKACPGQEKTLRDFLVDLRSRGSRLAIPKERLERAPFLEYNHYRCMPRDPAMTTCSTGLETQSATQGNASIVVSTMTTHRMNIGEYAASIYSNGHQFPSSVPNISTSSPWSPSPSLKEHASVIPPTKIEPSTCLPTMLNYGKLMAATTTMPKLSVSATSALYQNLSKPSLYRRSLEKANAFDFIQAHVTSIERISSSPTGDARGWAAWGFDGHDDDQDSAPTGLQWWMTEMDSVYSTAVPASARCTPVVYTSFAKGWPTWAHDYVPTTVIWTSECQTSTPTLTTPTPTPAPTPTPTRGWATWGWEDGHENSYIGPTSSSMDTGFPTMSSKSFTTSNITQPTVTSIPESLIKPHQSCNITSSLFGNPSAKHTKIGTKKPSNPTTTEVAQSTTTKSSIETSSLTTVEPTQQPINWTANLSPETAATTSSTPTSISTDGLCGGSIACGAGCCSFWGWCGSTRKHCGIGCQPALGPGPCSPGNSSRISGILADQMFRNISRLHL